ncbi:PHAX RNA-binding domain-containing protein [Ditylenchus destructor]|uniref:Phosphorylated adapter RNA export protein n=1 Tax=Ditylenchus destructor TaxID=166010 RepID=A0AAD4ND57_9BILA|nr:PHAX RNA-binding domain-containing protein [Ditylenchus destructor]
MSSLNNQRYPLKCPRCRPATDENSQAANAPTFPGIVHLLSHFNHQHCGDRIKFACTEVGCRIHFSTEFGLLRHRQQSHPEAKDSRNGTNALRLQLYEFLDDTLQQYIDVQQTPRKCVEVQESEPIESSSSSATVKATANKKQNAYECNEEDSRKSTKFTKTVNDSGSALIKVMKKISRNQFTKEEQRNPTITNASVFTSNFEHSRKRKSATINSTLPALFPSRMHSLNQKYKPRVSFRDKNDTTEPNGNTFGFNVVEASTVPSCSLNEKKSWSINSGGHDNSESTNKRNEMMIAPNYDKAAFLKATFSDDFSFNELGSLMAKSMGSLFPELVIKAVNLVGREKSMTLFKKCQAIEKVGGITMFDGSRRRTPDEVFVHLFHWDNDIPAAMKRELSECNQRLLRGKESQQSLALNMHHSLSRNRHRNSGNKISESAAVTENPDCTTTSAELAHKSVKIHVKK